MVELGPVLTLGTGGFAVVCVVLYLQVFRLPFQLRKARAFLHFRMYEHVIIFIGAGLLVATGLIHYDLAINPSAIDGHDLLLYMAGQLLIGGALIYIYATGRKA